jgi:hypothetical protein
VPSAPRRAAPPAPVGPAALRWTAAPVRHRAATSIRRWAAALAAPLALALAVPPGPGGGLALAQPRAIRELAAEAPAILRELARLRGLPSAGPPPHVVIRTRDERRQFILGEFRRKYGAGRLDAERRAMVAWGLIPPDFDLTAFLTDLVLEQAAAYYDPVGRVMVLANWLPRQEQREVLTHELVHLLQDRQIGLDRFLTVAPGRGDEALARQAVIEGEAVALTLDRTLRRRGEDLARLPDVVQVQQAIVTSTTGPVFARAPRFLQTLLTFPYAHGLGFVHQFLRRHPWIDFSRVYADPPRSTAQILQPERYLDRREDPEPVTLPDLGPLLGGARQIIEDDAGQFGLGGILAEFLAGSATAAGWRGDRYGVWDGGPGPDILVARSRWESEDAAAAFAGAYGRLLARKHGLPPPGPAWEVGGRAFGVERRGREVVLYERLPAGAVDPVRRAIWPSPS